jgi:hypothetical protein
VQKIESLILRKMDGYKSYFGLALILAATIGKPFVVFMAPAAPEGVFPLINGLGIVLGGAGLIHKILKAQGLQDSAIPDLHLPQVKDDPEIH